MEYLVMSFRNVLNTAVISSLLIFVIILIRSVCQRKLSSRTYYALWIILLARLAFPFTLPSPVSIENVIIISQQNIMLNYDKPETLTDEAPQASESSLPAYQESFFNNLSSIPDSTGENMRVYEYMALVWLFGMLAVFLFPIVSYYTLKKDLRAARSASHENIIKSSVHIRTMLKIEAPVSIKHSSICAKPALIGIFKPVIVLPEKTAEYEYGKIYTILLHELIHYKKKHLLIQWLFWFVKSVFWFNPLVWIAHSIMKQDAECWCDEEVLSLLDDNQRVLYGNLILDMISVDEDPVVAINATGFGNKASEIRKRIMQIAQKPKISKPATVISICLLICLIPVLFTVKTNNLKANRAENLIQQNLELEEKNTTDNAIKIQPVKYEFNTKNQLLTVYIDYRLSDKLNVPEIADKSLSMYTRIEFPGSVDPKIRKSGYPGEPLKGSNGRIYGFSFDLKGYEMSAYGIAMLVFEGAQLDIPIDNKYEQSSFYLSKENLPYSVCFDNIAGITFNKMSINTQSNSISLAIESESFTGAASEPFITYTVNRNGMQIKSTRSVGSITKSDSDLSINIENMFDTSLDENETIQVKVESITLFVDRYPDNAKPSWRFAIITE